MNPPLRIEANKDMVINELLHRIAELEHEKAVLLVAYRSTHPNEPQPPAE